MLRCSNVVRAFRESRPICRFQAFVNRRTLCETVSVSCASNGSITLEIHHPKSPIPGSPPTQTAVIYLPRGPLLANPTHDASNVSALQSTLSCPVVKINYRIGKLSQYPTPIHDVAAGFDWIVSNLLPKRAFARTGRSGHVGRLAVCGELIGGQLATALALTECRVGEPGIVAAAVNNPIVDWVDLPAATAKQLGNTRGMGLSAESLLKHRDEMFRKPEHYFDPFASPALFFRTSQYGVPEDIGRLSEMEELALMERAERLQDISILPSSTQEDESGVKKRKSSRRYPSKALGLRLPPFYITSGTESILSDQATELAHLLRKSFERENKTGDLPDPEEFVRSEQCAGLALWDDTESGRARMTKVASWIAEKLDA